LINYYEILGLNSTAGILEIKASFRQLAKIYHPDKNPEGIEHFTKILKAYETLSDPALKATYDYKLNYFKSQNQYQTKNTTSVNTKTWKFDERELKRRQYYNDHIKKYAKQTSEYMAEAETKKNYNEFKYILFATPLAVILFLLIMNLATRDRREILNSDVPITSGTDTEETISKNNSTFKTGDEPYTNLLGKAKYDSTHNETLKIKNLSHKDAIFFLFSKKELARCFFVLENDSFEIKRLPLKIKDIYYMSGLDFDTSFQFKEAFIKGGFSKDQEFYKSTQAIPFNSFNELTLLPGITKGFKKTDEKDFFKRIIK